MFTGTLTLCAVIALFSGLSLVITPIINKWFDSKGICDESGVDHEQE